MRRRIENRIEVPGTPEQVWEAIATGPGIEAWFVPAEVEPRTGGRLGLDMGGGMEDAGIVTEWSPPHRFAYEEAWPGPDDRVATEFLVEARSGGTCVVRLITTLHTNADSWDDMVDNLEEGWTTFLHNLRLHLAHFAGQSCTIALRTGRAAGPLERAFAELLADLGLEGDAPARLTGTVEHRGEHALVLRLTDPAPGTALVYVYATGDAVSTNARLYLYGEHAAQAAREWMAVLSAR